MIGIRCISTLKSNFYIDYLHCVLNHPFFSLPSRTVCAQLFLISFSAFLALASWVPVSGLVPLVVIPTLWPGWSRNTHICPSVPPLPSPEHSPDSPASMLYGYHPPLPACRALLLHWPRLPSSSTFRAVLISMPLPGLASVFETIFSAFRFLFILHILQDSKSALSFSCLLFSLQFLTLLFFLPYRILYLLFWNWWLLSWNSLSLSPPVSLWPPWGQELSFQLSTLFWCLA